MRLRIREIREDRDYTQKYVCEKILCDQSLYSKYELGKREIPLHIMVKLADLYNTTLDYLVGRTDDSSPLPPCKKR